MRTQVVLVCLALVACAMAVSAAANRRHSQTAVGKVLSDEEQFVEFMKTHNKKYAASEMFARFNAFRTNLAHINAHNVKFAAGQSSYKLGVNHLADLTHAEYLKRLHLRHSNTASGVPMEAVPELQVQAVPDSYDWRDHGAVNAVQDQMDCGSCWAFSATASLEATDFLQTKQLKKFSEQMCVDCVLNGTCTCDLGGEMHDCFVLVHNQGEMLEKDYPYKDESLGVCHFDPTKAVGKFGNYVNVTQYNETALKVAASQMVISVGIDASSMDFQFYESGVYDEPDCAWKWEDLDHGVDVVGYGTDKTSGLDYWLVRNSWNADWGLDGYIWMSRNKDNQCGIATDASFVPPTTAAKKTAAHAPHHEKQTSSRRRSPRARRN